MNYWNIFFYYFYHILFCILTSLPSIWNVSFLFLQSQAGSNSILQTMAVSGRCVWAEVKTVRRKPVMSRLFDYAVISSSLLLSYSILKSSLYNSYSGLERTFSAFGLIHSKLRNQLSNDRVMKLVSLLSFARQRRYRSQQLSSGSNGLKIITSD